MYLQSQLGTTGPRFGGASESYCSNHPQAQLRATQYSQLSHGQVQLIVGRACTYVAYLGLVKTTSTINALKYVHFKGKIEYPCGIWKAW